jgi:hypothetical protein
MIAAAAAASAVVMASFRAEGGAGWIAEEFMR